MNKRREASRARIDDLIRELGSLLFLDDGEGEHEPAGILTAWAIVTEWNIPGKEEPWQTRGWAPGLSPTHAYGLYHEGLYGEWDTDD